MDKISDYALPLLKKGGYFVAYKAKTANVEIEQAQKMAEAKVIQFGGDVSITEFDFDDF